jgi:hypothetical protein
MGAAGFWIALAAVLVSGGWFRSRSEEMKHETIRRIVEKSGEVDEAQLKALFQPPVQHWPNPWLREPVPGGGYRALRILGTLGIFAAGALGAFAGIMLGFGMGSGRGLEALIALAIAAAIGVLGIGLFFSSRFLPKPLPEGSGRDNHT